jgi:hypothetical protein
VSEGKINDSGSLGCEAAGTFPDTAEGEDDMSESLGQAVELLAAGDWKKAHEIVQKEKSTLAAWIHGIVHILEGDLDNARGWYKRAEREFPGANAAPTEIAEARRAVASGV